MVTVPRKTTGFITPDVLLIFRGCKRAPFASSAFPFIIALFLVIVPSASSTALYPISNEISSFRALLGHLDCESCQKYGNCNLELQKCECPFGRTGDTCEIDLLSACRRTPDSNAYCDDIVLLPCECLEQCHSYLCHETGDCDQYDGRKPRTCYQRGGVNTRVGVPFENETDIGYYIMTRPANEPPVKTEISYEEAVVNAPKRVISMPLEECGEHLCNERGQCLKGSEEPDRSGMPRCNCYHGFHGPECQEQRNVCPNQCGGHGVCKDYFCHCEPSYWGIGCARSKTFSQDQSYFPNPVDFKIYIYDLPTSIAYQQAFWAGWQDHDNNYVAYRHFLNHLLQSDVRTENPEEAHLFFLPAVTYAYSGNLGSPNHQLTRVARYVKQNFPYWNRTDGRDHIIWTPSDRGSCYLDSPEAWSMIKLTHFGYFDHTNNNSTFKMVISNVPNTQYGCFHPLRDVVMPPFLGGAELVVKETFIDRANSTDRPLPERDNLVLFAGSINPDDLEYSGGTRQKIAEYINKWNDPDVKVVEGYLSDYNEVLRGTKFCLAVYGHGYGMRILSAMFTGCIPLVIQEHVFQPYEDVLPYEEFSIRLNNDDIPNLPRILKSVTPEQLARLQEGVKKYYKAFLWQREADGLAFEYSIQNLKRRYLNLKSKYYGRHKAELFKL